MQKEARRTERTKKPPMKSELVLPDVKNEQPTFPLLARAKDKGHVVLFENESDGQVVKYSGNYPIGYISETWTSCFDVKVWEILPPGTKVILTV